MKPVIQLAVWVRIQHEGQLIRRTEEPYYNHLLAVATMASKAVRLGYEIGLCHDLLEDTDATVEDLSGVLREFGYGEADRTLISTAVVELTDFFTADLYPELSKSSRKKFEFSRLLTISPTAQTVKYADLIYNTEWVLQYDHKHAKHYAKKKRKLLNKLTLGDQKLWKKAMALLESIIEA